MTTTREQMDRVLDEHFAAEHAQDLERLLATLTDDAEHDAVGFGARRGKEEIRSFYEELFEHLQQEGAEQLRRCYGADLLVDEVVYTGQADGTFFGAEGGRGRVSFRMLHVIEFRDGLMSREQVWLDFQAVRRQLLGG